VCAHENVQFQNKIKKGVHMNKKILLSAAAAATLALTFTGCGTDDIVGSSLSGSAVKADLNGSTVTIGGVTTTTSSAGAWSFSGNIPAGSSSVSISGGNYNDGYINGQPSYADNNVTLTATTAQVNAGMEVSMLTKLANEFDGNFTKAGNALGIVIAEGATPAQIAGSVSAADFEKRAVQLAAVIGSSTNVTQTLAVLESNASVGIVSLDNIKTISSTYGADINTSLSYMEQGNYAAGNLIASGTKTAAQVAAMDFGANNVINVDSNDTNGSIYNINAGNVDFGYANGAITSNSTLMDNNGTVVAFKITDHNSTLTNVNGNTSLFVKLTGLDGGNSNNSYVMGLTGITVTGSANGPLALSCNGNGTLRTYANSNTSYAVSANSNASVLNGSNVFLNSSSNYNTVNVARFKAYMDSIYSSENSNSSTIGNYTGRMSSGNFSLKVYVNVADQNMTYNSRVTKIVGTPMAKTMSDTAETLWSGVKAYKVLDANLSY
jgi:hypothetical protein